MNKNVLLSGLFTLFTRCLEMSTSTLLAKMGMVNLHVSISCPLYMYNLSLLHTRTLLLIYFLNSFALVAEVIFVITSAAKDVCGKLPTERLFLDKYRSICLTLDEIIWKIFFNSGLELMELLDRHCDILALIGYQ
ncbi:hypothetical protein Godav_017899 [Gossypium davidsonii]|uniref:Coatomer subunit zeta n=4 Tax=Gossypium TaxID=3633 RepID=A0A7J8QUQ7_GOSDV|nr:hypothetical protein [Gossypium davidsonii]